MSITTVGISDLRAARHRAGARLEAALRQTARTTAGKIRTGAQARVRVGTGQTKAAIRIVEGHGQVRVEVADVPGRHPMVPVWLEFGTSKMPAQPFMGPALDAERAAYARAGEAANAKVLSEELG